jgi:hypothetical protein
VRARGPVPRPMCSRKPWVAVNPERNPPKVPRKPRKPAVRASWLLAKIAAFVGSEGWLPSVPDLVEYAGRRAGSRWSVWRSLRALQHVGLVQRVNRVWAVTPDGFEFLGMLPAAPRVVRRPKKKTLAQKLAETRAIRRRRRLDAALVFDRPIEELPVFD